MLQHPTPPNSLITTVFLYSLSMLNQHEYVFYYCENWIFNEFCGMLPCRGGMLFVYVFTGSPEESDSCLNH